MDNRELADLLAKKGIENDVTISGADLKRLLDLAFSYNFLADFVKKISEHNFTEDQWRNLQRELNHPLLDLIGYWAAIDDAKALTEIHPSADWS